ncbi:hypothetical protein [Scytonema millei]|nr:hypothetical protein [Scytonema millei]
MTPDQLTIHLHPTPHTLSTTSHQPLATPDLRLLLLPRLTID